MSRLDPRLLLQGYASGIFPMADGRDAKELFWVEPRTRAILPLDGFHLSRSLKRTIRSGRFAISRDRAFATVIAGCANREETWINAEIERAMLALHASGHAHSVEAWNGTVLAGGVYGVRIGRAFFAESMFSRQRDASKVALAWLVARLKVGGYTLLDCQFMTDHLASLGAANVPRATYSALLSAALGGASGSAAGAGAGSISRGSGSGLGVAGASAAGPGAGSAAPPAEFGALDRLLDAAGAGGDPGTAGYVIAQLLGQTS